MSISVESMAIELMQLGTCQLSLMMEMEWTENELRMTRQHSTNDLATGELNCNWTACVKIENVIWKIEIMKSVVWCTQLSTCYSFQFSPKTRQTMPLYDYLTPKLDFKRKFNHRQSFLYKGRLTVRTIGKLRTGSSVRIESRIGSSIRTRIESRSFAGH